MQSGANDARADDTSRLKVAIAEWLNSRDSSEMRSRLSPKKKLDCGIRNDVTGHLLCPIDYAWDDPEYVTSSLLDLYQYGLIVLFRVRAKLRNGVPGYKFSSSFFLRCLYEDEDGDPASPELGFLKGPLLLHVSFYTCVHCVILNHFDFRPTAIYLHLLRLPPKRMKRIPHPKSYLGDMMLLPRLAWVAM